LILFHHDSHRYPILIGAKPDSREELSKKRKRAIESEDEEPGGSRDRLGEAIGEGILFVVGLYLIYVSNWNWLLIGIGAVFAGSPVLQIPAIRIAINNKTGHQIFSLSDSQISDSNIIQKARDVHIYEAPRTVAPETPPPIEREKEPEDWEVDEEFTLEPDGYREFRFELEEGDRLVGSVEADEDVSCYVLGRLSVKSFEDGENFNPYWENEDITRTKVSYVAEAGRTYFFVVYRDEDEDEDASVSVKLLVES